MFDSRIADAEGHRARVTPQGDLVTVLSQNPPLGDEILTTPFVDFLTVNGEIGGDSNLIVDGSGEPVEVSIAARTTGDVYLTTFSVLLSDSPLSLNRFGGSSALNNGLNFFYESPLGRGIAPLPIRTNFDLIRLATLTQPIGTKTDAFQLTNAGVDSEDAYAPVIDLTRFGSQSYGIRLRQNSRDRLGFIVNDNLTGLTVFNILAFGFTRVISQTSRQD